MIMNSEKNERKKRAPYHEKGESIHQLYYEYMEMKYCCRGK